MASLALKRIFVHDVADLDDYVDIYWIDETDTPTVPGDVRMYAGGCEALVVTAGAPRTTQIQLPSLTQIERTWLEDHMGRVVMVRDTRGRVLFGVYLALPVSEDRTDPDNALCSLELRSVTYSVEV